MGEKNAIRNGDIWTAGPKGAVLAFFWRKNRLSLHANIVSMLGGIPPKYREFVAAYKHSEVVGNSAPKVL